MVDGDVNTDNIVCIAKSFTRFLKKKEFKEKGEKINVKIDSTFWKCV